MLLNNIKIRHQARQIVAMDWARGVAVVDVPAGGIAVVHFDPTTSDQIEPDHGWDGACNQFGR